MIFQSNDSVDGSPEAAGKLKGAGVKSDPSHQKQPKEWGVCEATTVNSIGLIPWAVYLRTFHQSVIIHWIVWMLTLKTSVAENRRRRSIERSLIVKLIFC